MILPENIIESDEDKRIMVEADLSKGQKGNYLVFLKGLIMIKMRNSMKMATEE